jgi:hypothetical protein
MSSSASPTSRPTAPDSTAPGRRRGGGAFAGAGSPTCHATTSHSADQAAV